jgi:RNA polymerase sigma factor (sigma-70 family)
MTMISEDSSPASARASTPPLEDAALLQRYVEGSNAAFAELVGRRVGLVYSVALRQTHGDAHRAEEATQAVFTDLARKAHTLAQRPVLAGWLYRSAQFAAAGLLRAELRRQRHEREASTMQTILAADTPEPNWDTIRPVLDEALSNLEERDRDAVLLRFFDGRRFSEIGAQLALTENAARMRVERALDKLQAALASRGITSTSAAVGFALGQQAAAAVPSTLAATVAGAALAAVSATGATAGALFSAGAMTVGVVGAMLTAVTVVFTMQVSSNAELRREIAHLEVAPERVAALRAENQRLEQSVAEVDQLRGDDLEFKQLAQRVAELQQVKARQAEAARQKDSEKLVQLEIDRMNREGNALVESYRALVAQSRDASSSATERAERDAEAKQTFAAIQAKQREIQAYIANVRAANPGSPAPARSGFGPPMSEQELARRYAETKPGDVVSLRLPQVDQLTALTAYELYVGSKVLRDPSLQTVRGHLDLRLEKVPRAEAAAALQRALADQLNIVVEKSADGNLVAKRGGAP